MRLFCGLFTSRWVLMALGQEDFGLYGVIGGLVIFIGLINGLLGGSLCRFYAVSVGAAGVAQDRESAVLECRKWFSSAVLIHTVVPLSLIVIGWPLGEYAILEGWIAVPAERLLACQWVFRFSCLSCFVGMVCVPFNAMYMAKQLIAELTIYSFATTTFNMFFFHYMASHPGEWLVQYAGWMAVMAIAPALIIAVRAYLLFPECRLVVGEILSLKRFRQLANYAGWQAFGALGAVARVQGMAILLNRHEDFGPMRNSSLTIANQVASQSDTLASAMVGAFQPAIANAYGAEDYDYMRTLAFRSCKYGVLLSMIFILPLALELPEELRLWLRDPPTYTGGFCWCILAAYLVDRTTTGHMLAVNALGRIAKYQAFLGGALILALPLAWMLLYLNFGVYSVGAAIFVTTVICAWGRVGFARTIVRMSARYWLKKILIPTMLVVGIAMGLGCVPQIIWIPSFARVCLTTAFVELALLPLAWYVILDEAERGYLTEKLRGRIVSLRKR